MASIFYNRYIPPAVTNLDLEEASRPSKKRKKAKLKLTISPRQASTSPNLGRDTRIDDATKGLSPIKLASSPSDDHDLPMRDKHQTVFSKYEKAAKQSTRSSDEVEATEDEPMTGQETEMPELHGLEPLPQPSKARKAPKVSAFSALPEWLQSPTVVHTTATVPLKDLSINQRTVAALQEKGYDTAFAIQSAILPMLLPGPQHYHGDLCVSAATGSGKTLAYALPMIEALRGKAATRLWGLIVVPTRELVNQVKETLDLCRVGSGLKIGTAVGSKSLKEEQALIIQKGQKYDPECFKAEQEKEIDEDEELMDWDFDKRYGPQDDFDLFYNHIVEYTSKVDILICTPGRVVEHIQSTKGFTLEHVQWLVIDEADKLLDESFQQWVDVVVPGLEYLPPMDPIQERISNTFHLLRRREIRKIILSATMTSDVSKLTALKLRGPRLVVLEGQKKAVPDSHDPENSHIEMAELPITLQEIGVKVLDINEKPLYLIRTLNLGGDKVPKKTISRSSKPTESTESETSSPEESTSSSVSDHDMPPSSTSATRKTATSSATPHSKPYGTLIFTKTNEHATRLARLLSLIRPGLAPSIGTLTKSSASSAGRKALSSFRKRRITLLIASDRASRGLDIQDLAHVINYDMPTSLTSYIHRVGRTARAGKEGKATTLIADNEARWFWNEIARSKKVGRGPGMKIIRDNAKYEFGDEERALYEKALQTLGKEAKG